MKQSASTLRLFVAISHRLYIVKVVNIVRNNESKSTVWGWR